MVESFCPNFDTNYMSIHDGLVHFRRNSSSTKLENTYKRRQCFRLYLFKINFWFLPKLHLWFCFFSSKLSNACGKQKIIIIPPTTLFVSVSFFFPCWKNNKVKKKSLQCKKKGVRVRV
jgi:hypothetical protein